MHTARVNDDAHTDATPPLVDALSRRLAADEGGPVQRVQTHISWVLLTPQHAYKLKRPVNLGFIDFTTLDARRHYCEAELRLNQRLAPALYLAVLPVCGTPDAPHLGGPGEPIDWVVQMRRFPDGALWSEQLAAGTLLPAHIDAFAAQLAAFHAQAPRAEAAHGWGLAPHVAGPALNALASAERLSPGAAGEALRLWLITEGERLAPLWAERAAQGHVRECHGDLHLANVVTLEGGQVTAFDCLEFDPALRWIDVMSDAGFLVMDLWAHGRRDLAFRFLNAWLDRSGQHDGLPVLRYYLVYRALVRGMVGLMQQRRGGPDYLALARELATLREPRLLITCGLPGSGKSRVSGELLEAAGAIRLRSDVERKRLHGLDALAQSQALGLDIYTPEATEHTFAHLREMARVSLGAGWPTIVDAANLKRAERDRFSQVAQAAGAPFAVLACEAPPQVLRERVTRRAALRDDPSEAGPQVLEKLMTLREPLGEDERPHTIEVDTTQPLDAAALAQRWRAATRGTRAG